MANQNEPVFKTWINMLFRCTFTILPFIFGIGANYLFSTDNIFYGRGEFLLYSVSLIASSILAYQSLSSLSEIWKGLLNTVALIVLVIISGIYAMLAINSTPNLEVMKNLSVISFIAALLIYYFSQLSYQEKLLENNIALQKEKERADLLEFQKNNSDALNIRNNQQNNMLDQLN